MEPDYKHEGKQLLLRALTAMVENVEMSTAKLNNVDRDGETHHYNYYVDFDGEDIVNVYRALVSDDEDSKKVAANAISSGISDALLKSIMSD